MARDNVLLKYTGKMIDEESGEPVAEEQVGRVTFYMEAEPWMLLAEGGFIDRKHKDVEKIRQIERESLALLRADNPFTDPEPQAPAKDAAPTAKREFEQAHADWDERRINHDRDLKERAALIEEDPNIPREYVVRKTERPFFVDREYVRIETPGDPGNVVERPVRPDDIRKWRDRYAAWKENKQSTVGTPLEVIGVSKAQKKTLAFYNVDTVEDLAKVTDAAMSTIGPFVAVRQRARDHVAAAKARAPVDEARKEIEVLRREIEELKGKKAEARK